jgi:hypothetical protein
MIRVKFTPQVRALMRRANLSPKTAALAVNQPHRQLTDRRGTRLVACHWLSNDSAILVDSEITKAEGEPGHGPIQIEEVVARVVLGLRPELPLGRISRDTDLDHLLAVVAENFGLPLTCDPDEPLSTLYSGTGGKERVLVHTGCIPPEFWLVGSFDPDKAYCEFVWAFRPDRYRAWSKARMV